MTIDALLMAAGAGSLGMRMFIARERQGARLSESFCHLRKSLHPDFVASR